MYKCRYFCTARVELQKGVTRSLESWGVTYCGPCLPIFKNISKSQPSESSEGFDLSAHQMRCFAISHWILRFSHNLQGSSRQKSRFAFFCRVSSRVCGVLRLVCVHVSVLNVAVCLKNCQWDWREKNSSKFALKPLKFSATAAELRVDFHLKTGWRWQNHGIDFESPPPDQALKPLIIRWTFPWEIWFTNIVDMIVPIYAASAPSALSALFGILWVGMWKVQGGTKMEAHSGTTMEAHSAPQMEAQNWRINNMFFANLVKHMQNWATETWKIWTENLKGPQLK